MNLSYYLKLYKLIFENYLKIENLLGNIIPKKCVLGVKISA